MNAGWIFNNAASALLLPPLNLIVLCIFGIALRRRYPRCGLALSVTALFVLTFISTLPGAMLLVAPLENLNAPLASGDIGNAQAIVVLGAGRIAGAPEYAGQDIPSSPALHRMRYAARLHRETALPILVTGGQPDGSTVSEAAIMARSLRDDFAVPVRWQEGMSNNTAENAQFSFTLLHGAGIKRIVLVTDAMHMQRAKSVFRQAGFDVVAAPTIFVSASRATAVDYFPRSIWLHHTAYAMHEWLGLAWYQVRHRNMNN